MSNSTGNSTTGSTRDIYERPLEILQNLVRFDTTNPPGNEAECIGYIKGLLDAAGIPNTVLAKDPNRPNLVARVAGRGDAPPLVLQGHVDVVTTANQEWERDPFGAEIIDGYMWGRGTLDMKGGVTMMLAACLRAQAEDFQPAGDMILTIMADEENGSDYGARFLVEEHPEQFEGAKYAIGEGGGGAQTIFDQRYYSIMVAEKQVCWMRATFHGPGGHGSSPLRGGAMGQLGQVLRGLDTQRLPVHITPAVEPMIKGIAESAPPAQAELLLRLLDPSQTDATLDTLIEQGVRQARMLDALLHNTISPTVVHGGYKTNVIPSHIELELDGRVLPGYTSDDIMRELRDLIGLDLELEIIRHDPGRADLDMGLFPFLAELVHAADPQGKPIPTVAGGFTDGRMFARLGIQNYGFLPVKIPADFESGRTVHAANERVPVDGFLFGVEIINQLVRRYTLD